MKTNKFMLTAMIISCIGSTAMATDVTTHDYHTGQYPVAESVKNSVIYGHDTNVTQAQGHLSGIIAGGENNTVQLDAHNSATFGISNNNNSENSVVTGSHNTITNANNSIAGGIYNASHSSNTAVFGYNNAIDFNSDNSFAGGKKVKVQGQNSFAFGEEAHAFGNNAIAIGKNVEALGDDSINIGANNTVQDSLSNGVIIGTNNTVNKYYSGELTGKNIVAIGNGNLFENSSESIAIGGSIIQGADRSVGIGANSKVAAPNSVALGYDTFAYDVESTESAEINGKTYTFAGGIAHGTVGIGARGDNGERTITGLAAGRINEESTDAINGSQLHAVITEVENNRTKVNDTMEEAKKHTIVSSGNNNIDIVNIMTPNYDGTFAKTNEYAVSLNNNINIHSAKITSEDENDNHHIDITSTHVQATGTDPFGNERTASMNKDGFNAVDGNRYSGLQSSYLHFGDTAKQESAHYSLKGIRLADNNSDPIEITKENISFGDRQLHNVKAGTELTDAVNVSQLKEVENKITNISNIAMDGAKSYTDSEVSKVGAASAALSALHPLEFNKDDKWQFAVGFGNYKNKTATAIGAFYQPNENILLSLGTTLGTNNNMVNGGATFKFGKHSNKQVATDTKVKNLEQRLAEMEAKYNELLAKIESK